MERSEFDAKRKTLGREGEERAAEFLRRKGFTILDRNFRCRLGELDIICRDESDGCIVFCEVKTRRNLRYGRPAEAVTESKMRHLRRCAQLWLLSRGLERAEYRIDVVELLITEAGAFVCHHKNCVGI